jgi:integrase-like protein
MDQRARTPIICSFERHLRALNRSERTIETYLISLRQAEAFLRAHGTTLEAATRADLEAFMADVLARGRAPSTAATYHKVLKLLYAWLVEEEEILTDPIRAADDAATPRCPGRPAGAARAPASAHLRARVARSGRHGGRPYADRGLEVPRHAAAVWGVGR